MGPQNIGIVLYLYICIICNVLVYRYKLVFCVINGFNEAINIGFW